ncbi:yiaT [Symbiodinium pilosum]|uniref:YiaT protein n=1 Tax=Symbiodinium pilosum TaxID=2952 RepID=A0A812IML7_SYMPI|nr:yiaT [Symbiodinium pilosum]
MPRDNENSSDLVPLYYYEGEYLFAHGTSFGVHLLDSDHFKIDLVSRYRFDRIEDSDDPFFEGVNERRQSLDSGLSVTWKTQWGELSTSAVHDSLDRHGGSEVEVTYRYPWRNNKWLVTPFISYVYQDSTLADYYYGVSAEEARPDRPAYEASSARSVRLGVGTTYKVNKRFVVFANAAHETLDSTVKDSPLVDEDSLTSAYLGFAYQFGNTLNENQFTGDKARFGEWSWRINYGYTAEKTFLKLHNGAVEKHDDIDTDLAGLTFGKLLRDGRKVEMWGKFSVNRRLENDLQDDFWEYNTYVMAMGVTLVHRSGIFASSDILNNVSGGSDVLTGHVAYLGAANAARHFQNDEHLQTYFEEAVAYAMFPRVYRAGAGYGAAYGHGWVFRKQGAPIGKTRVWQFSAGPHMGAQFYEQIIFFKTEEALALFQAGTLEFAGQANATVGVANVSATPAYNEGVAIFTNIGGGLMLEGSIGGHLYNYRAVQ